MNKHFAFFLILLFSVFSFYQFDSHLDGLQFNVEQENVTFEFSTESIELPFDDSGKQTSFETLSLVPYLVSLIITMASLSYMLIAFLRNLALLAPVRFNSKYVVLPSFNNQ